MQGAFEDRIRLACLLSYVPEKYWGKSPSTEEYGELRFACDSMEVLKKNGIQPAGTASMAEFVAKWCADNNLFPGFFSKETILVPAPSSDSTRHCTRWIPKMLADALVSRGLGRVVVPCLKRVKSIRSAHLSMDRPTLKEQYDSMGVVGGFGNPSEILLVDDIVTTGTTFMGAYRRIAEKYPDASIRAFAAMRTRFAKCFREYIDPCCEVIIPHTKIKKL